MTGCPRVKRSALLLNAAIAAAEGEGNCGLVTDLLRVKQRDARRKHNQRICDLYEHSGCSNGQPAT
jgi:hypothetical protein